VTGYRVDEVHITTVGMTEYIKMLRYK